jgi:hypothetical protein
MAINYIKYLSYFPNIPTLSISRLSKIYPNCIFLKTYNLAILGECIRRIEKRNFLKPKKSRFSFSQVSVYFGTTLDTTAGLPDCICIYIPKNLNFVIFWWAFQWKMLLFSTVCTSYVPVNFNKRWIGLPFGRLFYKLVWSLW